MKHPLRLAILVLGVALLALLIAPSLIDWNRYKPWLESRLESAIGRDVTLAGDLRVHILPRLRIEAEQLRVANIQGASARDMLALGALDIDIALWPLLLGEVRITSLAFVDPILSVEHLPDGRSNLDFASEARAAPRLRLAGFPGFPDWDHVVPVLALARLSVVDGRIFYLDHRGGWAETFGAVEGVLRRDEAGGYGVAGSFKWRERALGIDGALKPALADGQHQLSVHLKDTTLGLVVDLVGRFVGASGKPWSVGGALKVSAPALGVGSGARALSAEGALALGPTSGAVRDVRLRWGDLALRGGATLSVGDRPHLILAVQGGRLDLDRLLPPPSPASRRFWPLALVAPDTPPPKAPRPPDGSLPRQPGLGQVLTGQLQARFESLVFREGVVRGLALDGQFEGGSLKISKATALLPGAGALSLSGTLTPAGGRYALAGEAAVQGKNARELLSWLGATVEAVEPGRLLGYGYKGHIEARPGRLALSNFVATLDGGRTEGTLALTLGRRLGVNAALKGSHINVDRALALIVPRSEANAQPQAGEVLLDALDGVDGAITLDLTGATVAGLEAGDVALTLALSEGRATASRLVIGDLLGARIAASGRGEAFGGRLGLALEGRIEGADLRPLLAYVGLARKRGRAPLGPASIAFVTAIKQGSGPVTARGTLAGARLDLHYELASLEAPLRGKQGLGSTDLTLALTGTTADALGRLIGFGGAGAVADGSARPGELALRRIRSANADRLDFAARVGEASSRVHLERRGVDEAARYDFRLEARAADAPKLLAALGFPASAQGALGTHLVLDVGAKGPAGSLTLAPLSLAVGEGTITGEGHLDLSLPRPRLDLALNADALDLDRLATIGALDPWTDNPAVPSESPWSNSPLDWSFLDKLDGTASVAIERLALRRLALGEVRARVALDGGTLTLTDGRGLFEGGPFTATLTARGGKALPGFGLSLKVIEADGSAVTRALWGKAFLKGPLAGAMMIETQGTSEAAMAASAAGTITLKCNAGTLSGLDPAAPNALQSFTGLDVGMAVSEGQARVTQGQWTLADGAATLSGSVALAPWRLNLNLSRPTPVTRAPARAVLEGPVGAPALRAAASATPARPAR